LSDEYELACEDLGLSLETLKASVVAAANSAFLPQDERAELAASLQKELSKKKG
jgi:adenosine deaminase